MRRSAYAPARALVVWATSLVLCFGVGGLVVATSAQAASSYVATQAVNVRSGPGTSYRVIGVLALGTTISGSSTSSAWVKVSWQGATGYVWGDYLRKTASPSPTATPTHSTTAPTASPTTTPTTSPTTTPTTPPTTTPTSSPTPAPTSSTASPATKVTTADLNVRAAPSVTSTVVKVLRKGSTVHTTGITSERWAQITIGGALSWVSSLYLADKGSASTLPPIAYTATATTAQTVRTSPGIGATSAGTLKSGSAVALTGTHSGSYSQIVYQGAIRWVLTGYLDTSSSSQSAPTLPRATGTRYVKVDAVNIRATSASNGAVIGSAGYGTLLSTTGKTASNRTQVIFNGAPRWAYSAYLAATRPSSSPTPPPDDDLGSTSLNKTNAYAHVVVKKIRAEFPTITTIYGWRMSSAYSPDHPAGRALDIMIPSYKSAAGKALGDRIARYLQDNYTSLHVHYLIWRQRQWNVERNTNVITGWRKMADRGSDTDNHMNHVHVTVYDP